MKIAEQLGCFEMLQRLKKEGKARFTGFSFHDTAAVLDDILTRHPEVDVVQIQLNYLDWDHPVIQSQACYEVCCKHNKPVIVMEPVKGGILADPPQAVKDILDEAMPNDSYATAALRFTASHPGIVVTLSGMSALEQAQDNCRAFRDFKPLDDGELAAIDRARAALKEGGAVQCTSCDYCAKVCPMNIGVSGSFTSMNYYTLYKDLAAAKHQENWLVTGHGKKKAAGCIKCGACEKACPQHIKITEHLREAASKFERGDD